MPNFIQRGRDVAEISRFNVFFSKTAAGRRLEFLKGQILTAYRVQTPVLHRRTLLYEDRTNRC